MAQEAPPALEFSFSNPGARSMGLAGAFVALADDATAAFANPAGLVQLLRPEVSIELRRRNYATPYTAGGRVLGPPTGYGIDTVDGLRTDDSNETTSGLSYLSFVYPGSGWSLALYRHQLADFAFNNELDGLFGDVPGGVYRYDDQRSGLDLSVASTGLAAAFEVSELLSIGFGLTYFQGEVENLSRAYLFDSYPEFDTFFEHSSFLPSQLYSSSSFEIDGDDWGLNIGLLWKFAPNWRVGAVYRTGPEFDYRLVSTAGPAHPAPDGTVIGSVTDRSLGFPDVLGLGFAYRSPDGSLTVGFEWDRVEYSVVLETLDSPLVDTSLATVDDAEELHLGLEYVFLQASPVIAVRGGLWRDPDHRFRYTGDDPFNQGLFPPGEDVLHLTVGVGIAFRRFQIDLGADLSDTVDQYALSAILSF